MVLRSLRDTLNRQQAATARQQGGGFGAPQPRYVPPPVYTPPAPRQNPAPVYQQPAQLRNTYQPPIPQVRASDLVQSPMGQQLVQSARAYSGQQINVQPVRYRQGNAPVAPSRTYFNEVSAQQALSDLDQVQYQI